MARKTCRNHEYKILRETEHAYFTRKIVCELCGEVVNRFVVGKIERLAEKD